MDYFLNVLASFFFTIGVGVILHFYAYLISWGIAKGRAKVQTDINWKIPVLTIKLEK